MCSDDCFHRRVWRHYLLPQLLSVHVRVRFLTAVSMIRSAQCRLVMGSILDEDDMAALTGTWPECNCSGQPIVTIISHQNILAQYVIS